VFFFWLWSKSKLRVKSCQVCGGSGFQILSLAFIKVAQQSVQPTGGIRPDLQAFFWLRVFSCPQAESQPAHQRLTQTVVPLLQIRKDDKSKQRMTESVTHGSAIFW
jgi:hypothetical protein